MEFEVRDEISDFIFRASRAYTSLSLIDASAKSLFNLMSYGQRKRSAATTPFRTNLPPGRVVDSAAAGFSRILRVHRLFDVGGVSGKYIIGSRATAQIISRRFIRRKFLGRRRTRCLANRLGGRRGCCFHRRFWFCGDRADFVSPVIIIAAHITRRFGPTRSTAPSASRAKNISANTIFRSSCKTSTAISLISRCCSSFFFRMTRGKGCGSRTADGAKHFGIGVGTIVLTLNVIFLACYTFGCHSLRHLGRRISGFKIESAVLRENLQLRQLPQQTPHAVGVDQSVLGRFHRCLRPPLLDGHLARLAIFFKF